MQSRRKENKAIERKKKGQRRLSAAITCLVIGAVVGIVAWISVDAVMRRWIIEFEGTRVATSDMRFVGLVHGIENLSDPATRSLILEETLEISTIKHQAQLVGLSATAEQVAMATSLIENEIAWGGFQLPSGVSVEEAANILAYMNDVRWELMDHHVPITMVDTSGLRGEFPGYLEENREWYELQATQAQFIVSSDLEVLERIQADADAGSIDFEALALQYCEIRTEEGIMTVPITTMMEWFMLTEDALDLENGQVTDIIHFGGDQSVIVYMLDRGQLDEAALEETFVEQNAIELRHDIFVDMLESWRTSANYTVNNRALRSL